MDLEYLVTSAWFPSTLEQPRLTPGPLAHMEVWIPLTEKGRPLCTLPRQVSISR